MAKILLVLFIIYPFLLFSQSKLSEDVDVSVGNSYPVVNAFKKKYFEDNDIINMIKIDSKKTIIQQYNLVEKKENFRKVLPPIANGLILDIVKLKNRYYIIKRGYERGTKLFSILFNEISFKDGTIGPDNKIFTSKLVLSMDNINFSYDSSMFMISFRNPPVHVNDDKNFDIITMAVFNHKTEKNWSDDVKMPYTEAVMNNIAYCVNKSGTVFIAAEIKKEREHIELNKSEYNYNLVIIKVDKGEIEESRIDDVWMKVNQVKFVEGPNMELYLMGFINDVKKHNSTKNATGIFLASISLYGEILEINTYDIPEEIIRKDKSEREKRWDDKEKEKKGKLDFEYLVLRNLIISEDGEILIIGEQYYVVSLHNNTNNTYYYNDILITKIDNNGSMKWMKKLPKRQSTDYGSFYGIKHYDEYVSTRDALGFKYFEKNGKHYFLYKDYIEDRKSEDGKVSYVSFAALAASVIDDNDGTVEKSLIADFRKIRISEEKKNLPVCQFSVDRIVETSFGAAFEYYLSKKQNVMIHIELND